MADILSLQEAYDQTPEEEKASRYSLAICNRSYKSLIVCFVK